MTSLQTDKNNGLNDSEVLASRQKYGKNLITPPKDIPWWKLYLEKFNDPIILILIVATTISLLFGIIHQDFTESIGILCAILIATGVGFWQEYDAKKKFDAMKSDKDFEMIKVKRNGFIQEISKDQLVVGDIVVLAAGDEIPADIELIESNELKVSEATMTGESVPVSKYPCDTPYQGGGFAPNQLLRGTTIGEGNAIGIVTQVGDATEIGKTTRQATETTENKTPLEQQLNGLADKINIAAFSIASVMFIILNLIHWDWGWGNHPFALSWDLLLTEVRFLMGAIVVIIVAVPEGLPLSVTLALAFSMKTMAKEHNLVKKMHACETIGAVNIIFTDKTGTLTQNSMTVVEKDVAPEHNHWLELIGTINSTASWSRESAVVGNPTEGAILKEIGMQRTLQLRKEYPVTDSIPFSSAYKYMVSYAWDEKNKRPVRMIKGAPEVIARYTGKKDFLSLVAQQQGRGRRAISAAIIHDPISIKQLKEQLQTEHPQLHVEYIGTWFIEDPVRSDVPAAIAKCYKAGIDVIMMTGDNLRTGAEIGRQAGLKNIWAIEAKEFHQAIRSPQHGRALPNIIARCTPTDKLDILKWAQKEQYICAMTGDGVNDSPSLNHADVGIAMGTGTSVAKEVADIILLNDAFPSIVTGIKWGRSLYKNIQNFLFLQLSINVSACLIALLGPIIGVEMPFTVTQFLWINLVMDSLAAIALASEPADERVLNDPPRKRQEFIITPSLGKSILGFGLTICTVCSFILWGMNHQIDWLSGINLTVFFAAYMTLNWWNLFNARVIGKNKSIFSGLGSNTKFTSVSVGILVTTIIIVQIGGEVFQTQPLSAATWGWILLCTSPVVIVRELWFRLTQ